MEEMIVKVEDVTVSYDARPVLWDIDLSLPKGKLIAIVGPNGAGKSTLIKTMLGLLKPVTGTIQFNDKTYKEVRKKIAYVPQRSSVDWNFPTTVYDVVLMGRYGHVGWFKRPRHKDKEIVMQSLESLSISHLKDRQISELSGGQQQRVFLARALAQEAEVYFMDEPFQGVDVKTERAIVSLFKKLKKEGKTVVVVHHDLDTVETYFDHVVLLNRRIIAQGSVAQVFTQENIDRTYTTSKRVMDDA